MKKTLMSASVALLLASCGGPKTPEPLAVSGTVVEVVPSTSPNAMDFNLVTKAWTGGAGAVTLRS